MHWEITGDADQLFITADGSVISNNHPDDPQIGTTVRLVSDQTFMTSQFVS